MKKTLVYMEILIVLTVVLFLVSLCTPSAQANNYIPSVSETQVTISTLGDLASERYDEDFEWGISFLQMRVTENVRMTFMFELSESGGAAGAYTLVPLLKDRLFIIAGGSVSNLGLGHAGGGFQLNTDYATLFVKQFGERKTGGGVLVPFMDNLFHTGISLQREQMDTVDDIWRGGVYFGVNWGMLDEDEQRSWKKLLPQLEEAKRQLEEFKKEGKENETTKSNN